MTDKLFSADIFADSLLAWYDINKRHLPWRSNPTPYHIWISEIMLQQTQVQTVIPYYERFIKAFPTVMDLSRSNQTELFKLWEGLGYYSRATNLQSAAQIIVNQYDGILPESASELAKLPGIGPYTSGAIASIAFGERTAAVDGNVLRILSRISRFPDPINVPSLAKPLYLMAQSLVPAHRPGDFNQALMDLGATICSSNGVPRCQKCPLKQICLAYLNNTAGLYPIKRPKKPRQTEKYLVIILLFNGKIFLHKRPSNGLLAGLWEFVTLPLDDFWESPTSFIAANQLTPVSTIHFGQSRHLFTHREWLMDGYLILLDNIDTFKLDGIWISPDELNTTYPIPGALSFYRQKLFDFISSGGTYA